MDSGSQPAKAGIFQVIEGDRPLDWERVYRDHVTSIYRLLYQKVGNQHDAEDLTSQVFLESLPRLRASASGGEIQEIIVTSCDGRPLGPSDVMMVPGPGAAAATRERLTVTKTPAARRRSSPVRAGTDDLTRGA